MKFTLRCGDTHQFTGPEQVYVLDTTRTAAGLATISSDQNLCLFDPASLGRGPLRTLRTDHGNVGSLQVFEGDGSVVCTGGENGQVAVWDLRDGSRVAQFKG